MLQLARLVHENVGGSVGRPPARSDVGETYVRQRMLTGHGGREMRCLVVADNVWDEEVIAKLRETGMWVLVTTRDGALVSDADSEAITIDELSQEDAESVLRRAAELSPDVRLPDAAINVIDLCGRVAMDLAFAGRWGVVRGRNGSSAWSDAVDRISTELRNVGLDTARGIGEHAAKRRRAILCAGFQYLAIGMDDEHVQWLYLALGALPDGHPFDVTDAAALLYDRKGNRKEEEAVGEVVETLERWSILRSSDGKYRMHDAHSNFARENLMDRGDVRRPAVRRWVKHISSPEMLTSVGEFVLKGLWAAVEQVGGESWRVSRPYNEFVAAMDDLDPQLRRCMAALARFHRAQNDWEGESAMWRRLLEIERIVLGPDHPCVMNTLGALADGAERTGKPDEADQWRQKQDKALTLALARMRSDGGAEMSEEETANDLKSLASGMVRLAPGEVSYSEAESMLRRALEIEEARLGPDDLQVTSTLYEMGLCVRRAGRHQEGEGFLRRGLQLREAKLGPHNVQVAYTLHQLGMCVSGAGRKADAEKLFARALDIKQARMGPDDVQVARTLHEMGVCVSEAGRHQEAEGYLLRGLEIRGTKLGPDGLRVAYTLHQLGVCIGRAGRKADAEKLFARALEIKLMKLEADDLRVAYTLHQLGAYIGGAGRTENAEKLLARALEIREAKLGADDLTIAHTLHELGVCVKASGRKEDAGKLFARALEIREAKLGADDVRVALTLHELDMCVGGAGRKAGAAICTNAADRAGDARG